jgi:hypothetical protein
MEDRCGGAWEKMDKNGKTYYSLSITIGGQRVKYVMFHNEKKASENSPDWSIYPAREKQA